MAPRLSLSGAYRDRIGGVPPGTVIVVTTGVDGSGVPDVDSSVTVPAPPVKPLQPFAPNHMQGTESGI